MGWLKSLLLKWFGREKRPLPGCTFCDRELKTCQVYWESKMVSAFGCVDYHEFYLMIPLYTEYLGGNKFPMDRIILSDSGEPMLDLEVFW